MANTYTQIHIHAVFAVKNRQSLIMKTWKEELYKYMTGIVQNHGHKMLAINGIADHVHLLIGQRPTEALSDLIEDVKGDASKWINENRLVKGRFNWQKGFSAFSYAKSDVSTVINYIRRQEEHHRKVTFMEEYEAWLKEFDVQYDPRYIYHAIEDDTASEEPNLHKQHAL